MMRQSFEQISKGPKLIRESDLEHIIPLLRTQYGIDVPSEENITPQVIQHVWDKLSLHTDDGDEEGLKRQLAKELTELRYGSEVDVKTPEEVKFEAVEIINFAIKESFFVLEDDKADKIVAAWELFDTETKELILRLFKDVAAKLLSKKLNS
jgi:hypothetical protein